MKRVIDAHALMVFLEREPGFEKVEKVFIEAAQKDSNILISAVNFGEVYYIVLRECGEKKAEEIVKVIDTLPVEIIDVNRELALIAGYFKASKKMSYADCFSAALAKINKAELITGDDEFKEVDGEVKILWVR